MGIFLKIFHSSSNHSKEKDKEDKKEIEINNIQIENNLWTLIKEIEKDDKNNKKILCLKIYIVGKGKNKDYIKNNLFEEKIADSYLKNIENLKQINFIGLLVCMMKKI